jgi:hypothetical protein
LICQADDFVVGFRERALETLYLPAQDVLVRIDLNERVPLSPRMEKSRAVGTACPTFKALIFFGEVVSFVGDFEVAVFVGYQFDDVGLVSIRIRDYVGDHVFG